MNITFSDLLNALIHLSSNETIAGLLQVITGAGLLTLWFRARDRTANTRDDAIRFVGDTGERLNVVLSGLFALTRNRRRDMLFEVDENIGALFHHRFTTRVKSHAVLRSPAFAQEYDRIIWQLKHTASAAARVMGEKRIDPPFHADDRLAIVIEDTWESIEAAANDGWDRSLALVMTALDASIRGKRIDRITIEKRTSARREWRHQLEQREQLERTTSSAPTR